MLARSMNAQLPMLVTLVGIVTLVSLVPCQDAEAPTLVTGRRLVVSGIKRRWAARPLVQWISLD